MEKIINIKKIKDLNKIPSDTTELYCHGLGIYKLPDLPKNLKILDCSKNNIFEIDELPKSLIEFNCSNNKLPELPKSLTTLFCSGNILNELPELPESLKELLCHANKLTELPDINNIKDVLFYNNFYRCPIDKDILEKYRLHPFMYYNEEILKQYKTEDYQKFLIDNYVEKYEDIIYNFEYLEINIEFIKFYLRNKKLETLC